MAPAVCLAKKSPKETVLFSQIKEDMDWAKEKNNNKKNNYVKNK